MEFTYRLAEQEDSAGILEVLEEGYYKGGVSLLYTRRDDAYASLKKEGEGVDIILCSDAKTKKIAAVGACAYRTLYFNRQPTRIGHLFSLKAREEYRNTFQFLHKGYDFFHEVSLSKNVPFFLMTILEENTYAVKLFEKRRTFMPDHHGLGMYEVYIFKTGMKRPAMEGFEFKRCEKPDIRGLVKFIEERGKEHQFFPVLTEEWLEDKSGRGVSYEDFYILRYSSGASKGTIAACGAVWDQRHYKQYIVKEYNGLYKFIAPFSRVLPLLGYANMFEKPGSTLNFFTLSFWGVNEQDPGIFDYFIRCISNCTKQYKFFAVGIHEKNPFKQVLSSIRHFRYRSKIYLVDWDKSRDKRKDPGTGGPFYLECGML